jgi:hypothetical protein
MNCYYINIGKGIIISRLSAYFMECSQKAIIGLFLSRINLNNQKGSIDYPLFCIASNSLTLYRVRLMKGLYTFIFPSFSYLPIVVVLLIPSITIASFLLTNSPYSILLVINVLNFFACTLLISISKGKVYCFLKLIS